MHAMKLAFEWELSKQEPKVNVEMEFALDEKRPPKIIF